jgi:hypothetical protein
MFQLKSETNFCVMLEWTLTDDSYLANIFLKPEPGLKCWYDGHELPTDRPAVAMPTASVGENWRFEGRFCNWSCCKSFSSGKLDHHRDQRDQWIEILAHKTTNMPKLIAVPEALPWQCLKAYGGHLDIQSFRDHPNEIIAAQITGEWLPEFRPVMIVQRGIIQEPSNLVADYHRRLSVSQDQTRLVINAKRETISLSRLPTVESLRARMKLPAVATPGLMKPFDPKTDSPPPPPQEDHPPQKRQKRGGFFSRSYNLVAQHSHPPSVFKL